MKAFLLLLILSITSCDNKKQGLDYPRDIEDIKEVILERPDKETNGKFAQIRELSRSEISELLVKLHEAHQ